MKKWYETFLFDAGTLRPAEGALVNVYVAGGSTLASLFEDDETTPVANPVTADSRGYVEFKVADGLYDIVATRNGVELKRIEKVRISEYDPSNVAITGGNIAVTDITYSGEIRGGGA